LERFLAYMPDLRGAVAEAYREGTWIVVVVPEKDTAALVRILRGLVPDGSQCGGRTVLLPDGGRISLVSVHDDEFDAHGCRAILVGCEDRTAPDETIAIHKWKGSSVMARGSG